MEKCKMNTNTLKQFSSRAELGKQAAADVGQAVKKLLAQKDTINMVFAAAPSQTEFLENFCSNPEIEFGRINAFHMDEYIGLPEDAPQRFGRFLERYLFARVAFKTVNYIDGNAVDTKAECRRYEELIQRFPPDIICLGIGENGHIAFNDPAEADFDDPYMIKVVHLDDICRNQQVNDGCFSSLNDVPKSALTLTIPTLLNADYHFCMVPGSKKANAVYRTLYGEINENCPATILRLCKNIVFYIDKDSGAFVHF